MDVAASSYVWQRAKGRAQILMQIKIGSTEELVDRCELWLRSMRGIRKTCH